MAASNSVIENTPAPNSQNYRVQSAMVLFALEEALGSWVVKAVPQPESLPPSIRAEIEKRILGTGFIPVAQIVQETYIKEIIDLAVEASRGRAEEPALTRLRELVEAMDAFEVRNAVCHPNRQFPDCYWYRMAALATDPCIEQLRLLRVTDAFRCAVEGRLTPPPEGWLQQRSWSIPNNLPSTFDHQVTGLIARQEEARDFRKRLQNPRNSLVAIVGPGGAGKTALCLEVLRDCLLDPSTSKWADQLVYVSAKTEVLTSRGVEPISDPLTSLDSVKIAVATALYGADPEHGGDSDAVTFDGAVQELGTRRLLLCIDNLETLIRNHPTDFEEFVQTLPRDWRVLVTSRVTVNGANVLTLGPIRREGAIKLARDYTSLRGAERLDESQLVRLVEVCDRNPLAIRLVVDSYAAGSELARALSQTKDRITDFSYTSLVEHLHPNSSKALECLFGSNGSISRAQIGHLLDLSSDEVAEAVNGLLRTSLVTREVDGGSERYALSSSVRDLLLRSPRDARVREEVYSRLRTQQMIIAQLDRTGTKDPLNELFVPADCPDHIRALVGRMLPGAMRRSAIAEQVQHLSEVRRTLEFDSSHAVLHRAEALLLLGLSDRYGAIESFGKAIQCNGSDPCSQLRLAELLRDENRLEEAIEHTKPLIDAGYLTRAEVSQRYKSRLFRAHWVSILWLKRYDEVLNATDEWQLSTELRPSYVALRVSALQRYIDEGIQGPLKLEAAIEEILKCLSEGFRLDGYLPDVVHEGFRALDRLCRMLGRGSILLGSSIQCARFLDTHLPAMCGSSNEYSLSDEFVIGLIKNFRSVSPLDNPLRAERWSDLIFFGETEDTALANAGYETARVTSVIPEKAHLFARALDGTRDFFVRLSATDLLRSDFIALKNGQLLLVLPSEEPPWQGRAWPAKHVMLA